MSAGELAPYVPHLAAEWLRQTPGAVHRQVQGSMVLADISGFTPLTERLTRLGVVGSEELSDILDSTFAALLDQARPQGADLLKWGGDAVLLLFRGPDHAARAVRAALGMRRTLRSVGRTRSSAGEVRLRMSVGVHSGAFDLFLVGDPAEHRELIVCGPASSRVAELESAAAAGQVAVSRRTAALLSASTVTRTAAGLLLVRRAPGAPTRTPQEVDGGLAGGSTGASDGSDGGSDGDVAGLLPPPLREHLLSGAREPEHRAVAVAFVEFSGVDALHRRQGPHVLAEALDLLVRRVQDGCRHEGVTFLESDITRDGGKIMLVCGAPRRAEDVEDRIVRAVRGVVDLAGPLRLRAGINRGRVFASDFGPEFRRTYSVKGDAVNLAARVMAHAEDAQVLATRPVLDLVDAGVVAEPVPPFMVKGRSRPVDAAAVTVLRRALTQHRAGPDDVFLGREPELARILGLLEQARTGRGQLVEVRGGPGLGKSALARAVVDRCGPDVVVLHGPSRRFGGSAAHQAVRRLLRGLAGVGAADPAEQQVEELRRLVEQAAPQVLPWLPLLAATMGVDLPDTPQLQDLDDRYRPAQAGRALAELLSRVLTGPALLVLEGADDMDEASVTTLREVLAVLPSRPWLVLVTRRVDDRGLVPDPDDGHPVVDLEPLRPATCLALLGVWADHPATGSAGGRRHVLGDQQLRALAAKAGGNPLHLHSLLELALARGSVDGLPVGVEEVIGAEVDELVPRARTILRLASVLGEQLDTLHLAELVSGEGWTLRPEDLRRLSAQLVPEGPSDTWYRFSSTLLHETVYAGLPYRLRRRLHLRAGELLEAAAATGPPPLAALSTHFFEAGRYDKALDYSRRAAERAGQAYSSLQALRLYERALVCAARTVDVPSLLVGRLHEAAGDAAEMAGLSATAIAHYRTARSGLSSDRLATGGLIAKEVGLHQRVGAFDRSTRIARYALHALDGVPGPQADALRSRLAVQTAFVHHLRARHAAAVSWSTRAVELALRSGDPAGLARAYNAHALVLAVAGLPADRPYGELALASSEESGDLRLQVKCLTNLAISAIIEGRWPRSESLLVRAAGVAERLGDAANVVNVIYNRCDVLVRQGRWAEALPLLAHVGREARAQDDQELVALVELELGKAALGAHRVEAARSHLTVAREQLVALGLGRERAEADVALLTCQVLAATTPAQRDAAQAGVLAALQDLTGPVEEENRARLHLLHGTLLLAGGHPAAAERAFDAGASAPHGEGGLDQALALLAAARAAARQGRDRAGDRSRALADLGRLGVREPPFPAAWWSLDRPAVVVQDVDDDEQVAVVTGGGDVVGAERTTEVVLRDTLGDART